MLLLVLGILIAGFIIINIKNGFDISKAEAQPSGGGNVLYVGGIGANNYTKIQDAIDNASDGDTIFVYNGTYYENVIVNKTINLIGGNRNRTIIDGGGSGNVVNITADGVTIEGFTIRNSGPNFGVKISSYNNSIYNCSISNNGYGIGLDSSNGNSIYNCSISNNDDGIVLGSSSNNSIYNCTISNNYHGIYAYYSSNNSIYNCNIISNNDDGIWLRYSSNNNILTDNNASNNNYGVLLSYSSNNNLTNNNANSNNWRGISLSHSSNNILMSNNVSNNSEGIGLWHSTNNTLINNTMSGNMYNFGVHGWNLSHYIQSIDTSNKVDGKPIYYWVNEKGRIVPSDAGYVGIINSTNITVKNLNLMNNGHGVQL
ncbi:MAG: right-handed parallel beta-helix repeat-containing protein, partial [Thermoplasmata archaeon]|nr:right-handed parallel beta-helix repeat-containing protein [Thermoplasmata archaeon]